MEIVFFLNFINNIRKYYVFFQNFQIYSSCWLAWTSKKKTFLWGWSPQEKHMLVATSKNSKLCQTRSESSPQLTQKHPLKKKLWPSGPGRAALNRFSRGGARFFAKFYLSFDSLISRGSRPYHRLRLESQ